MKSLSGGDVASVFLPPFKVQYSAIGVAESIETGHVTKHSQTCAHTHTHTHSCRTFNRRQLNSEVVSLGRMSVPEVQH